MSRKVAIIGYSFRLPGACRDSFWNALCSGRDLISQVDPSRWETDSFHHPDKGHPASSYTFAAGTIGPAAGFDADFFGISPREAACMDPQQRLLLELSWEAMEHAGVVPSSLRGSDCGVYIGVASTDYAYRFAHDLAAIDATTATGNTSSILANRISYFYNLHGPSMAVDTACSSSLFAFHQACQAITSGEIDSALTGGISLHLHPYGFLIFAQASMLSSRGRCTPFDASADGYVRSEGGGIFLLKEYERAIADGDHVLAVVAASGVNNDGRKTGLTVPSADAQADLIEKVCLKAGLSPEAIDYFEAHGTGTPVGDPIEASALGRALGQRRSKERPLPIGSIKSNIGHLEAAAGVAGIVKALLSLQHRMVPATIGVTAPNPAIDFTGLNLELVTENRFLGTDGPLHIGINSFGFGGANAHVILSGPVPVREAAAPPLNDRDLPLVISARNEQALKAAARNMSAYLGENPGIALYDTAHSSLFRREQLPHRLVLFGRDHAAIAEELSDFAEDRPAAAVVHGAAMPAPSGPVFVYAGNGAQWEGMGRQLLADPVFRGAVESIDSHFRLYADFSLVDELAGRNGTGRYEHTEIAQPALFAVQAGITCMLRNLGVEPSAVIGHSVGEIAAAWACGALTLQDAIKVIYHRSRLQGLTKGRGMMSAVSIGREQAAELLTQLELPSLALAGCNSPSGVTIAGTVNELDSFESHLSAQGIRFKRLNLDYAFHSPAMDGIEQELLQSLADISPHASSIPFYSTVTGELADGKLLGAHYWWLNIREPVLFEQAAGAIIDNGMNLLVSVNPHAILKNYLNAVMEAKGCDGRVVVTALRDNDDPQRIRKAAAEIMIAGGAIELETFFPTPGNFVRLPGYPWQREQCWHSVTAESARILERRKVHPLLGYRLPHQDPAWENHLDTRLYPMLADHAVGEATVFPATGFLELVLAAAIELQPDGCIEVEQLEIRSPLLLESAATKVVKLTVAPADGRVNITARELLQEPPWTHHGTARIVPASAQPFCSHSPFVPPDRDPDFTGQSHLLLTRRAGLGYGPAFQGIRHGWVEGLSASALLLPPEQVQEGIERYHLHPALLDCALQLVFQIVQAGKSEDYNLDDTSYLPVTLERVRFQPGMAAPAYAQATLTGHAPHSLIADVALYDYNGRAIATVSRVRFRRARLVKRTGDSLSFPAFHRVPMPMQGSSCVHPSELAAEALGAAEAVAASAAADLSLKTFTDELDPLLESLCGRFSAETLRLLAGDGNCISENELQQARLGTLAGMAVADGAATWTEAGLEIRPDVQDGISARQLWQGLINQYPQQYPLIHRAGRIGLSHASLPQQPESQPATFDLLYQVLGDSGRFLIGNRLRQLVVTLRQSLPEGSRLTVLEAGEAAPLWLHHLCSGLDFEHCEYRFASASPEALDEAAQWREQYQEIRLHDLAQEEPSHPCQATLAVVTCNFSSQASAEQLLEAVAASVAPGGCMKLAGLHPLRWAPFLAAGQELWQQGADWYEQLLERHGMTVLRRFDLVQDHAGPWIMVAQKPQEAPVPDGTLHPLSGALLLVHDDQEAADELETIASRSGIRCIQLDTASGESMRRCLDDAGEPVGILFATGTGSSADTLSGEQYLARQIDRCSAAMELARQLELDQYAVPVWLLTTGSAADLDGTETAANGLSDIADSSFWAFGRTMMNEFPSLDLRLICLEAGITEHGVEALMREAGNPGQEQEVIIGHTGKRYVPRLALESFPGEKSHAETEAGQTVLRLGFAMPGQLRNLRWEQTARITPANDEIEIEVHATGLNFRDIMYTQGLISDEAVENGFAGATLGLECAGIVTSIGPAVTGFSVGDRVVAFGPASFSTRARTRSSAVSRIPAGLGFEAAATIPAAFFTSWYALCHLGRLQPGEKVLIHGAAGGVGLAAVQIAQHCGAQIFATAGSDEKRDFLRLLGVRHIYDSRSLAFADQIIEETGGEGIDLVLNSLAGEAINSNLRVLKPLGRFLELGKRDFYENTHIGLRPFRNNISYFGIDADQLMQLQPELTHRLFSEIMSLFEQGALNPLPFTTFEADQVVDAFRYMQQSRQIGKVIVTYRNGIGRFHAPPIQKKSLELPPDGTWLVTGGLGGLGLRTAQWLADKGCRNLVLISRSGPTTSETQDAIGTLQRQGVRLHAAACDVADRAALADLLKTVGQELPPLKGVVHAATVIEDGLLRTMDVGQLHRVMAPKILGALNLHQLTDGMQLDYFVLFSSATTLFGNPGQGNYVAANGWMEGLARMRRAVGLPATVARWGAIDDVGFLARNGKVKEALQSRMGGTPLQSATVLDLLEQMLLAGCSGIGVLELDWPTLRRSLPSACHARYSTLANRFNGETGEQPEGLLNNLAELPDPELHKAVADLLKQEVGQILRIQPDKIAADRSLHEMGLDSLMGVELVTALEARFGIQLPVMALSEGPTIVKLTARIVSHIRGAEQPGSVDAVREQVAHLALQHATGLSKTDLEDIASGLELASADRMID